MPIHDWTRVPAGIFHHFHHSWIEEIQRALNAGLLPREYYALSEQLAGRLGPDVLTLHAGGSAAEGPEKSLDGNGSRSATLLRTPPRCRWTGTTERERYARKQKSIVIRHTSGDDVVALLEIVSPGNKDSRSAMRRFVEKAADAIGHGCHMSIVDLQPPTKRDSQGIHALIWEELADEPYTRPPDKPLTIAAYDAGPPIAAFVEPVAVGDGLPDMPLFLEPEQYVNIPLEATYLAAWQRVPQRWQQVIEP